MTTLLLCLALSATPEISGTPQADLDGHRFSLGVELATLDLPNGHLGIPFSTTYKPGIGLVGRYQFASNAAFNLGVGLPSNEMGLTAWAGFELLGRLWEAPNGIVAIELYEDAGLQLGFAGPEYYARLDQSWVGTGYVASGPLAFALRLPVGLRLTWFRDLFDTSLEATEMLVMTPSVESLFDLSVAVRVHF